MRHPNILQITTHDSGRHFGCYGHATLHTPAIDALAADGVRLANYFCTVPICCASRASQLTGLYPQTHGLLDLCFAPFNWRIRDNVKHLSQWLKTYGYETRLFGMQHEVAQSELPRLEFDSVHAQSRAPADAVAAEVAAFLQSRVTGQSRGGIERGIPAEAGTPTRPAPPACIALPARIATRSVAGGRSNAGRAWPATEDVRVGVPPSGGPHTMAAPLQSRGAQQRPFYAQVGFFETHTPFGFGGALPDSEHGVEVPAYLADAESSRLAMAGYQGAIRKADTAVATIMTALRLSGLEEETIVVFTTDHGIEMPRAKWFLYDPGIAIGLIVRYPRGGVNGGRALDQLLSNVDYLPTIMELAGLPVPDGVQGRSFAGLLGGERSEPARDAAFAMYHKTQSRCVRTNDFSLIRHFDAPTDFARVPVRIEEVLARRGIRQIEFFDLKADPNQFTNVAGRAEYTDVQRELDDMLWQWMKDVDDPLLQGPVRTPSYELAMESYARWKG